MSALARLRREEYTGENRCLPCTVTNAVVIAVAAGFVWFASPTVAVAVAALGATLIALRGYVIPYTPSFAPRLVAPLPFEFGHGHRNDEPSSLAADDGELDPEALLVVLEEAGVLTGGSDLELAPSFREGWEGRMRELRTAGTETIADRAAEAAPYPAEGSAAGDAIIIDGGDRVLLNRPVTIAETAAIETLREWGVEERYRAAGADPLRLFLRECPDCGGTVVEEPVGGCCGGVAGTQVTDVLACTECETVLRELPPH